MIAGTIGTAAAAEFAQVAEELDALVSLEELFQTPRSKRRELYPKSINGLVGLVYAVVATVDEERISDAIDIIADLRHVEAPDLPLGEVTNFGFEILIRKSMAQGLTEAFRTSQSYRDYAKERTAACA